METLQGCAWFLGLLVAVHSPTLVGLPLFLWLMQKGKKVAAWLLLGVALVAQYMAYLPFSTIVD